MNPYRDAFYHRQAEWHGNKSPEELQAKHEIRARSYRWYTRGWLPSSKSAPILDIACGAGQFVYFLKKEGYENVTGIDLDKQQVDMAKGLGLNCVQADALKFMAESPVKWSQISTLDVLEHLTPQELFQLMELISASLAPGGRLILSVPNAESPQGLLTRYSDITHESSFGIVSMSEVLFCHGLRCKAVLDPWPTPIDVPRKIHRVIATLGRRLEGLKLRSLGLGVPKVWSSVFWMLAVKE